MNDLIPVGLILVVLAALNIGGIVILGAAAMRAPVPVYEPIVYEDEQRTIGGDWRQVIDGETMRRYVRESEFPLPEDIYVNNHHLLPVAARAFYDANSMSREVLLGCDLGGQRPRDNERLRQWHNDVKELWLDALWATPGPGGGVILNEEGREALRVVASEGDDGLVRLLRRIVEARLAAAGVPPALDAPESPEESGTRPPPDFPINGGGAFMPTPVGRGGRRDN